METSKNKGYYPGFIYKVDRNGFPITKIHLENHKGGDPVPVYKVRMREGFSNAIQLKESENRYAIPRNNHHIMISVDGEEFLRRSSDFLGNNPTIPQKATYL